MITILLKLKDQIDDEINKAKNQRFIHSSLEYGLLIAKSCIEKLETEINIQSLKEAGYFS